MNYYGTPDGGEQHDEYHRPLPEPQPGPGPGQLPKGVIAPSQDVGGGQWAPPPEHEAATQLLPLYPAFQPPAAPSAQQDADATQLLPPQAPASGAPYKEPGAPYKEPGTVCDESGAVQADDAATTVLRPVPSAGSVPGAGPVEATQRLPLFGDPAFGGPATAPIAPQVRQQGAFDHLYRQPGPSAAAPQTPQDPHGYGYDYAPPPRRRLSRGALIGIVVGSCAVAGLAAGAALSSGGTQAAATAGAKPSAATGSPPAANPATTTDVAAQQAKQLDALLEESGTSRSTVIQAVADIKGCQNLGSAAAQLRSAADQRNNLVSRLGRLSTDKLPNHQALDAALNRAWKASAAADNHYADWAHQAAGKKGCKSGKGGKGGNARITGQTIEGNVQSGVATEAKKAAVRLWNAIAVQYGLRQRTYTQL